MYFWVAAKNTKLYQKSNESLTAKGENFNLNSSIRSCTNLFERFSCNVFDLVFTSINFTTFLSFFLSYLRNYILWFTLTVCCFDTFSLYAFLKYFTSVFKSFFSTCFFVLFFEPIFSSLVRTHRPQLFICVKFSTMNFSFLTWVFFFFEFWNLGFLVACKCWSHFLFGSLWANISSFFAGIILVSYASVICDNKPKKYI